MCIATIVTAGAAHADPLPWLASRLNDPLATEERAARLVARDLKPASCGTIEAGRTLYLNGVVIGTLCNNPDTRGAYLRLVAEAERYATNYAGYLPTATGTMSRSRTTSFAEDSKTTTIGSTYGLSLGMTLYDFGQREFKLETAEHLLIAAGHTYSSTLQGAIAAALQGYYNLLRAQNAVAVATDSERFARESYEAAQLRHEIGQVPLADELQAKGAYSQALLASEAALNGLALQQASLAQLMGLGADTPLQVAEVDNKTLANAPFGTRLKALIESAKTKRHDLQSTRAGLRASETSLSALKRANLATVSVTANMQAGNDRVDVFSRSGSRSQAIGLSVSIPIFTGFSQTYTERAAESDLRAQREALTKAQLSVELDVWNAWHNYETAKRSWETSQDQMASANQLKDVALGRYKEGLGSILDVLNAQLQYSNALQSQLENRHNLLTTRVDLIRA
ncbi:MAG: TolC family protein, partial [Acidobacteriales bacterium]|nr:TolC family protein [Terriglobales bacterium]